MAPPPRVLDTAGRGQPAVSNAPRRDANFDGCVPSKPLSAEPPMLRAAVRVAVGDGVCGAELTRTRSARGVFFGGESKGPSCQKLDPALARMINPLLSRFFRDRPAGRTTWADAARESGRRSMGSV